MATIEEFAELVPESLMEKPGRVFYSGRRAFEKANSLYILGLNSGGDPNSEKETITEHMDKVLNDQGAGWSRYVVGKKPFHRRMEYLFKVIERHPADVPASNIVFLRSKRKKCIPKDRWNRLTTDCWRFHKPVIDNLKVRVIVSLGKDSGEAVRDLVKADKRAVDCFTENYEKRKARSFTYRNDSGLSVVQLTHPSYADWTSPSADPTGLVQRALEWAASNPG